MVTFDGSTSGGCSGVAAVLLCPTDERGPRPQLATATARTVGHGTALEAEAQACRLGLALLQASGHHGSRAATLAGDNRLVVDHGRHRSRVGPGLHRRARRRGRAARLDPTLGPPAPPRQPHGRPACAGCPAPRGHAQPCLATVGLGPLAHGCPRPPRKVTAPKPGPRIFGRCHCPDPRALKFGRGHCPEARALIFIGSLEAACTVQRSWRAAMGRAGVQQAAQLAAQRAA